MAGLIRPGEVAVIMGRATEPTFRAFDSEELRKFDRDLTKLASVYFRSRDGFSIVLEDRDFYLYAGQIAVEQLGGKFAGCVPAANEVGFQFIRPKTVLGANHWFRTIASAGWNDLIGSATAPVDLSTTSATYGNPQNRVLLAFPKFGDYTVPKVTEVWINIGLTTNYPIWPIPLWHQADVYVTPIPYGAIISKNDKFYVRGNVLAGGTQIAFFPLGLTFCLGSYMVGTAQE